MSAIRKMDKVEAAYMEPHISGNTVFYSENSGEFNSYACLGCGWIWDRKWQAETCEGRRHASRFEQGYGGGGVNGVYKPATTFIRTPVGRMRGGK